MGEWREKATEMLPELRAVISDNDRSDSPTALWVELICRFKEAFDAGNNDLVQKILQYARYCLNSTNDDVSSAAAVGFIESLPVDPKMAAAIPTWFTQEEFIGLEELFEYHGGAELVAQLRSQYQNKK